MNTLKRRILFVEDDEIDRMAFERFAQQEHFPYNYIIADSVKETRQVLKAEQFNAAVIDYTLGDGTAFDLFNDLEGTPIIIVTGIGAVEIAVKAMKIGAYDYLIKDTEGHYLKTLSLTVENAIKRKQAEDELQKYRENLEELVKDRTTALAKTNKKLHQEIIERKQIEEALREERDKARKYLEVAGVMIVVIGADQRVTLINKKGCEILGYSEEEILGKNWFDHFLPESNREKVKIVFLTLIAGGVESMQYFENPILTRNGEERMIAWHNTVLRDQEGRIVATLSSGEDITERKRAEEELQKYREHLEELVEERTAELQKEIEERKQVEEILAEERNLLQTLIDNLPDYIYVKDTESRFLLANKASMWGLGLTTLDELVGKTTFDFFPEELSEQYFADEREIFESGQPLINREEQNIDLTTGVTNWMLTTKVPLRDSQGHIIGIVGISRNITEHKRIDEELQHAKKTALEAKNTAEEAQHAAEKALQKAEAANRAKSQFLANMSHELRTPLNAILGFTQLMERDPLFPEKHKESLEIISRSGEHLLGLINNILELSKIEAGQQTLVKISFNLYHMLEDLEEMIRLRAEKKGLFLIFEQDPDVPQYIKTDEHKLRQILINLLDNAIKFTEEGEVRLKIENCQLNIENRKEEESSQSSIFNLQFSILDTGPGIAPEELDTLFETFTQTQSGQKTEEGTGLGLALSRQFVLLMEGQIRVSSQVGQGTTFTVEIPIEPAEASEIRPRRTIRRVIGLETDQHVPNGGPYRILVADDSPESRMLLQTLLEVVGFTVQEASNGQQAIELHESWQPHLIWMDLRMPIMDGYEATKRIRELERQKAKGKRQKADPLRPSPFALRPVPIIAITSSAFEEDRAAALMVGCDDFVRKPFHEADIFAMMHKYLGVRYVYDKGEGQQRKDQKQLPQNGLNPTDLVALPSDLLINLEQAIAELDREMIYQVIKAIRPYDASLADALKALADNFQYDKILTFIQK